MTRRVRKTSWAHGGAGNPHGQRAAGRAGGGTRRPGTAEPSRRAAAARSSSGTVALLANIADAQLASDPTTNAPVVNIVLDSTGARIFRDLSREHREADGIILADRSGRK
jgi:preprotein translocase subunit SecD